MQHEGNKNKISEEKLWYLGCCLLGRKTIAILNCGLYLYSKVKGMCSCQPNESEFLLLPHLHAHHCHKSAHLFLMWWPYWHWVISANNSTASSCSNTLTLAIRIFAHRMRSRFFFFVQPHSQYSWFNQRWFNVKAHLMFSLSYSICLTHVIQEIIV